MSEKPNFERLLKVLWLEEPDRVPFYEHFVDLEVIEHILSRSLRDLDLSKEGHQRIYVESLVKFYKGLKYDYVPFDLPLLLQRTNIAYSKDLAILSRGKRMWVDESRGTIETMEDFKAYPWPDPEEAIDVDLMKLLTRSLPDGMMIIGGVGGGVLEHVMWIMGFEPFFRAIYREPKLIDAMFNKIGSLIYECLKIIADVEGIGALRLGDDMGYRKGTFISPAMLRRYVLPWHMRCADLAHKRGMPFILHSCGNLEAIMDDILKYVDAKHSFEDAIMSVTKFKRLYGDKIAILGGVDVDKMARLGADDFSKYVKHILDECAPGGGYALGSGNSVTNYIKVENYLLMLRIGLKYGRYAKRA